MFLKQLAKNINTGIVYVSCVQAAFWDAMPPGFHIPSFLHRKDLRTSKPGKKNLTAASEKYSRVEQEGCQMK